MKILFINSVCGIGSTGTIISDIYNILKLQNHECKIIYGIGEAKNVNIKDTYKMNNRFGYIIHNILSRLTDGCGYYSYFQTKKMLKYIDKFKPDVIHLHQLHGYYINIKVLFNYLKKKNIPVVWTFHDCWPFTGHCSYFDYENCYQWQSQCIKCKDTKTYYPDSLIDHAKENYQIKKKLFTSIENLTITTVSDWLNNCVKQSFFKDYNIETIHNGIDLNIYRKTSSNIKDKLNISNKKIIFACRNGWNSKSRRYNDLLKIGTLLDNKYQLIICGLNQNQIKNLPKNIIGFKRTENITELLKLYSIADVFINTTDCDTFGLVNIEALACGTPVITYNHGGCPECVDNNSGIIVEEKPEAIITSLDNALKLKSEDCIKRAKSFDKNEKYNNYINLYLKIIN